MKKNNGYDLRGVTIEEVQQRLIFTKDIWEIIDLLGITEQDIVYQFPDRIMDNIRNLKVELGFEDDYEADEDQGYLDFPHETYEPD